MKRIGILTAGGDTPALNATIHGAVTRACQRKIEVIGLIKGFSSLFNPRVPHLHLNPLYAPIPELDPTLGGTLIGASRDYVDAGDKESVNLIAGRLRKLGIEGLICVGGDGTLNGMQALCECLPTVLAPKTIDNDLGLNYRSEVDEWVRHPAGAVVPGATEKDGFLYTRAESRDRFDLDQIVNYVTPGYATAVFVSASGVQRVRTTAESHRRIAIVEVMGRHSGYLALGAAYGQPDLLLVPEHRLNVDMLVERIKEIYDLQKHCVIVCGEGIVDAKGEELGAELNSTDPSGNKILSGASEALRSVLIQRLGDTYFTSKRRNESAKAAIFTRKLGHTQRGGRPVLFDRFYAGQLGGHAVDMLVQGTMNAVSVLQYTRDRGFHLGQVYANDFRDRWGLIHARTMHPSFYDPVAMRPSQTGIDYLVPIFTRAVGADDVEVMRAELFDPSHLKMPYHSVNTDVNKRIRYLEE
ncbi:6-phosphofructokinase : 6-phosphofructokinase OS=Singulisphaera acidiphila (strain ATCC BAA-1392 / DSM 18658 / VKM B-2454 / MOB10) GN=Sinac_7072 PE=4 SV=1: PFK: PFK: PFK [Gemmataceae bacterium]|nr:6-phosphofructokinase : 6-phosphofructokinase OS=Singulisphaera acidiphila (strain ATCC BAA-1392 / DSM 18658 / VKM B-2454 / MOB10) GN=Sinac_7072 PE=4 SV=1: PFK: PFK: PFK [Gemmataceae bacterium]VTU01783.1 6-phosphofructokinase : 6-phosphofructokinase OS=Singulisphaera acidiphila (strain ATCC BAA-1392 / DSM 18658 / VKM B-2454 / MOB10) GN=Sinac_7072 PE=4 SV=1: PFK: PFK: PFK [Gemmataceae bacterium]